MDRDMTVLSVSQKDIIGVRPCPTDSVASIERGQYGAVAVHVTVSCPDSSLALRRGKSLGEVSTRALNQATGVTLVPSTSAKEAVIPVADCSEVADVTDILPDAQTIDSPPDSPLDSPPDSPREEPLNISSGSTLLQALHAAAEVLQKSIVVEVESVTPKESQAGGAAAESQAAQAAYASAEERAEERAEPEPEAAVAGSGEPEAPASTTIRRRSKGRLDRRTSIEEVELYRAAAEKLVPPQQSMHPLRAEGGRALFWEARRFLKRGDSVDPPPLVKAAEGDNGRSAVEKAFFDSMPRRLVEIEAVEAVVNVKLLQEFLCRVVEEESSVEATFHGTRPEYVESIMQEGLLTDCCSTSNYGLGAYVGTHAGIAHLYTDPDVTGRRFMGVVLVVVGRTVVKGKRGRRHQTTSMDNLVNPTQYCFVDKARLLLSHMITYRLREDEKPKRTGGGWDDPFARAMAAAVRRAGKCLQLSGVR